jgi:DNA-3-methyladenine glycosylase
MSKSNSEIIPKSFYLRPTLEVAQDIIGKAIVYNSPKGKMSARIVEVEAYIGKDDPACHGAVGQTNRNKVMFGEGGYVYIYFIYGMYYCLNFVTDKAGFPAAILLRAAEPSEGVKLMLGNSPKNQKISRLLSGPGKFCRAFGLTTKQNGLDLTKKTIYLEELFEPPGKIVRTERIGIKKGKILLYRFIDSSSTSISGK